MATRVLASTGIDKEAVGPNAHSVLKTWIAADVASRVRDETDVDRNTQPAKANQR